MNTFVVAACLSVLVSVCSAHMCLVSPHQRGSMMMLNKAGADDCILLTGPCGGRPMQTPDTMWKSGGNFSVTFQKNLDHWAMATPGYFGVALINGAMSKELARVPDMGEPSLHLYTASGSLPDTSLVAAENFILQVTYVTKNSQAPPVFYQCADVMIQ